MFLLIVFYKLKEHDIVTLKVNHPLCHAEFLIHLSFITDLLIIINHLISNLYLIVHTNWILKLHISLSGWKITSSNWYLYFFSSICILIILSKIQMLCCKILKLQYLSWIFWAYNSDYSILGLDLWAKKRRFVTCH